MELINADKMKTAFRNMFNLYAHELSQYNPWLGTQLDSNGNYLTDAVEEYLDASSFEAYCIVEETRPIGLAVFSSEEENGIWFHDVEELFLINTSRHSGLAEAICTEFWKRNKGIGTLHVLPENKKALRFWDKLLDHSGYKYMKRDEDGMTVYRFELS